MRLTTGFKYDLPFESWTPVVDTSTGVDVLTYVKAADLLGSIVQGAGGLNLVTEDALPLNSQVRNLKDSKGQAIFVVNGAPYEMYIVSAEPQFDPWMRIVGWKHRLNRELPRDYLAAINAAVEAGA